MPINYSENEYFVSNMAKCGYCAGRTRCNQFKFLTPQQLHFMRKQRPYRVDQEFCRECIIRIERSLRKWSEMVGNTSDYESESDNSNQSSDESFVSL